MVGVIPDELLLLEIFARLPDPVDLLRCAATCRRWLRLLGNDGAILRRAGLLPENENARHCSFVLGAFYQKASLVSAPVALEKTSMFPPQFGRLHPWRRLSVGFDSFIPNADGFFNHAKPLASSRGLLLARLLAVCNPLVGDVHLLPPPAVDLDDNRLGRDVTGYALYTGPDHCGPSLAFRVLFTAVHSKNQLVYAYSYSSITGNWSAPIECPDVADLTMSGPAAGVVDGRGTAHWLYTDQAWYYSLAVIADSARVSLTKIPIPVNPNREEPPFILCTAGGGKILSFVNIVGIEDGSMFELWTKREQDDDNTHGEESFQSWLRCKVTTSQQGPSSLTIFGFQESRGTILFHHHDVGLFS